MTECVRLRLPCRAAAPASQAGVHRCLSTAFNFLLTSHSFSSLPTPPFPPPYAYQVDELVLAGGDTDSDEYENAMEDSV